MDQFNEYNELFPPEILGMFLEDTSLRTDKHEPPTQNAIAIDAQDTVLPTNHDQFKNLGPINIGLASAVSTMQVIQEEPLHHRARRRSSSSMPSKLHRGSSCETCLSTDTAPGHCRKERRRQQNRMSQQKFREKKEARLQKACEEISELQASVDSLRNEKQDLHNTNRTLRLRIEELERSQAQITSPQDTISTNDVVCSPYEIQGTFAGEMVIQDLPNEKSSEWVASSVYSDVTIDISHGLTNIPGSLDQWFAPDHAFDPSPKVDGVDKSPLTKS